MTPVRDDRVLPATRVLAVVLVPILVAAFVILYGFPADTGRLFAWTISPQLTPMVLASAYLGGAWFFVRVARERRWAAVGAGFLAVCLFATLLGIATVLHWDRFNHGHVAFWLWATLYFVAPVLVLGAWLANSRVAAPPRPDERRIGPVARVVIATGGGLALVQGLVLFASPSLMIPLWPWQLTPLTCRVVGAIFCLGSAGLVVIGDPRWERLRLLVEIATVMLTLMLVGGLRARGDLHTDRLLTWLLVVGFVGALLGSLYLWWSMRRPVGAPVTTGGG
ncbi:hypothetical protein FHX52_1425 [Humibacillus xanthopallidus]|uniref:Uncharacterized protein n=1 Tax=Humibacillus xanthopallidus TaxID=412689 RepID=A0A543PW36_9MICO|nr:hypothetical protein [Humibacillus xanthopallidus]TQN48294.1 hypothetical protein FHX52_1425 [Humibacillus xanthopallidus]